jgi:hypothetical protein
MSDRLTIGLEFVRFALMSCFRHLFILPSLAISLSVGAQPTFVSPLDIPLILSGNFGELRNNHFHSGLDFKTQGREGLSVYSSLDGYVSRIKISPFGYGKALYISHPHGYTTVYAHLSKLSPELEEYVKSEHYRLQKFDIDLYPEKDRFKVTAGQLVAYSGNSGGSGGPHLHFEIRDSATEHPLNPLLFGFETVKDNRPPDIKGIKVYMASDTTYIDGIMSDRYIPTEKAGSEYKLKQAGPIRTYGPVCFGIHATDRLDGADNVCGIYTATLKMDSTVIFGQKIEQLDFSFKKHMNAHADYFEMRKNSRDIHRSHVMPGNRLKIYNNVKENGVVNVAAGEKRTLTYDVTDVHGNSSKLIFEVMGEVSKPLGRQDRLSSQRPGAQSKFLDRTKEHTIVEKDLVVFIPKGALFESMNFVYRTADTLKGTLSQSFEIGDTYVPLAEDFTIKIRLPEKAGPDKSKLLIVRHDPHNGKKTAIKTKVTGAYLEAESSFFGNFYVMEDKTKPTIKSHDFSADMKGRKSFSFKISDDLSGVNTYNVYLDGQWILADYDAKNSLLSCEFDSKRMTRGKHKIRVVVTDISGNKAEYSSDFEW